MGDSNEMIGSYILVAQKAFDGRPTVYQFAMNKLFDPSTDEKLLRYFFTGDKEEGRSNIRVDISKEGKVDEQTLFGDVDDDADRLNIADTLKLYGHPLSLGQTCADWFLMNSG